MADRFASLLRRDAVLALALLSFAACEVNGYRDPQTAPQPVDPNGAAPAPAPSGPPSLRAVSVAGDDAFAVGERGVIVHVTRETAALEATIDGGPDLSGVWAAAVNDVYAVGKNGTIVHRGEGGAWRSQTSNVTTDLVAVWGSGPTDVYVVGDKGTILHSGNRGKDWVVQQSNLGQFLDAVWGSDPADIYVGGFEGGIVHSTNGGGSWTTVKSGMPGVSAMWGSSAKDIFAVGYGDLEQKVMPISTEPDRDQPGAVLHSDSRGHLWSQLPVPRAGQLFAIWGSGAGDVIAAGASGTVLRSVDGKRWSLAHAGDAHLFGVAGDGRGVVFLVGDHETILRSVDGGATFTVLGVASPDANGNAPVEI